MFGHLLNQNDMLQDFIKARKLFLGKRDFSCNLSNDIKKRF